MMSSQYLTISTLIILFLTTAIPTSQQQRNGLVIWDVGQGAWATLVTPSKCIHVDVGGERIPKHVQERCLGKQNQIHLTHWDRDHIQFLPWIQRNLSKICTGILPPGEPKKSLRHIALSAWGMKKCEAYKERFAPDLFQIQDPSALARAKTSNAASQIFEFENLAIIPGDSGQKEERNWSTRIQSCPKVLVLGHHGSRTSTSQNLLNKMKCLTIGIASSRKKRYGHPHPEVTSLLRQSGTPVITTEAWGDIIIPWQSFAGKSTKQSAL